MNYQVVTDLPQLPQAVSSIILAAADGEAYTHKRMYAHMPGSLHSCAHNKDTCATVTRLHPLTTDSSLLAPVPACGRTSLFANIVHAA